MVTNFQKIENASTIVFSTPLMTLAATICDLLERAGIPAVLSRQSGCPVVAVEAQNVNETIQLLTATWSPLAA